MNLTFVEICDVCEGKSPFEVQFMGLPPCSACHGYGVLVWSRPTIESPWSVFDNAQLTFSMGVRLEGAA